VFLFFGELYYQVHHLDTKIKQINWF